MKVLGEGWGWTVDGGEICVVGLVKQLVMSRKSRISEEI